MKINIPKSAETIAKDERKVRLEEQKKSNKEPTLKEMKQLLLDIYEELK
jgi:hypothetical protein